MCIYASGVFALNLRRIFDNNFWGDECFTINLIQNPVQSIITGTAKDIHPPLYYFFVRIGYLLCGKQGWAFHLVSLIPCGIILIFSLTVIWKKFGWETSVILITLAGLSRNAVFYNVEVRMYSWGSLFVLMSFYELYNLLTEEKNKYYIRFALFSLAAAYTHYYCLMSVFWLYVAIICLAVFGKRISPKKVLYTCGLTVAGYMPWFLILLNSVMRVSGGYWITEIPTVKESINYIFSKRFHPVIWLFISVSMIIVFLYETGIVKMPEGKVKMGIGIRNGKIRCSDMLIWIISGIVSIMGTILFGIAISKLIRPFYVLRYIYPVSVIGWVILGVMISRMKGSRIYALILSAYMLAVFFPEYRSLYSEEAYNNSKVTNTLKTTWEIDGDNRILTNNLSIIGYILPYYYPEASIVYSDFKELPEVDENTWFFISDISEMGEILNGIEAQGLIYMDILEDGYLGTHDVHIYKIAANRSK